MITKDELPHSIEVREHVLIPMPDGTQLSARIWLPVGAEGNPVPAILEYIPYRKRDFTAARDAQIHPFVAAHGYACVRVDIRGSGDSDGVLADEYLEQELRDGEEILRWLAAQPWCTGRVGIIGISWGGFNGLQLAARRPSQLGAVVTVCSTDDRYADDVHYMGGCLLGDNQSWAAAMLSATSLPPDPALVGDDWRAMWHKRLEGSGYWLDSWLRHQRRDHFWKHGSICQDYSDVEVPVLAVSGWADGYSNAVFRLVANLDVPRKGLVGPWSHKYPHQGLPGPAIGFLQECVRWWDRWLKDIDTGVEDDATLRVWMQDPVAPTMYYSSRPGRWVAEEHWPSANIEDHTFVLGRGALMRSGKEVERRGLTVQSPLSVGLFAGKWCSFSATPDLPHDQREEDGGALVFQSIPLKETLELFGPVRVELELSSNRPVAIIAARLSSVAPDDKATRVTYGLLNLTHRQSHEHPERLEPGKQYRVTLEMNEVAQVLPKGHRIRLSLSTSYFPVAWPPPKPTRLRVFTGTSRVVLPIRAPRSEDDSLRDFGEPEVLPAYPTTRLAPQQYDWRVIRDLAHDVSMLEVIKDEGTVRLDDIDLAIGAHTVERYSYAVDDFSSAQGETRGIRRLVRGDWSIETVARTTLTSTPEAFEVYAELDAYEGTRRVFSRTWDERIDRDLL